MSELGEKEKETYIVPFKDIDVPKLAQILGWNCIGPYGGLYSYTIDSPLEKGKNQIRVDISKTTGKLAIVTRKYYGVGGRLILDGFKNIEISEERRRADFQSQDFIVSLAPTDCIVVFKLSKGGT
jgi:hypothetical protein